RPRASGSPSTRRSRAGGSSAAISCSCSRSAPGSRGVPRSFAGNQAGKGELLGELAFLFPGQGAQAVGMAKDLHEAYPAVRALYDRAAKAVPFDLRKISFEGPEEELRRTDVSQ